MKHTNETLSARDDDYISKLVGIIELKKSGYEAEMWQMTTFKDYCSSHADIMPIAFANKLSIAPTFGDWQVFNRETDSVINKNPLRAICECFILMNQGDV